MLHRILLTTLITLVTFSASPVFSEAKVDEGLATYEAASGVSGNFSSVGSDTLANLMALWA